MTKNNDLFSASWNKKLGKKINKFNVDLKIENSHSTNTVKNSTNIEKIRRPVDQSFEASNQLGSIIKGDNRK